MDAQKYFDTQAHFNKWLKELTEDEKNHVVDMLNDFHQQKLQQTDVSSSAGYVLKWIAGCPYNIDEATVPKSGIDTAPEQVVLNLSLNYKVWLALQEVAKHCH